MTEKSSEEVLDRIHQNIEDHLNKGNHRIKAWYSEDHSQPEGLPEIVNPPHQKMMEQSADMVDYAANSLSKERVTIGDPQNSIELLVYGVATELLLSGIHLKLDPKPFIDNLENQNQTPGFDDLTTVLYRDLSDRIPQEQMQIMVKVLDLLRTQRNNEAHLAYHRYNHSHLDGLILEAVYVLLRIYSESSISKLDSLLEKIENVRGPKPRNPNAVEFDIDTIFGSDV